MKNNLKIQENTTKYIGQLESKVKTLTTENMSLKADKELLNNKLKELLEQAAIAKAKRFGSSSEKINPDQIMLFNEVEFFAEQKVEEPSEEEILPARKKKKPGFKDEKIKDLPVETIDYTLKEEESSCPQCGNELHQMGKNIRKELVCIPAQYKILEHVQYVYSCRDCEENDVNTPIVKARVPQALISKSMASASLVANIITNKYMSYLPLYRQEKLLSNNGIEISRQCMASWVIKVAEQYLQPLYDLMRLEFLKQDIIHMDETVVQVLKEKDKTPQSNSYMWLYRSGKYEKRQIVLYEYQPDRKKLRPTEFLNGFKGSAHTDGYAAYHSLIDIIIFGCWAHMRRKFEEILKITPKGNVIGTPAFTGMGYCQKLYSIEEKIKDKTPDEKKQLRKELSEPVIREFFTWVKKRSDLPSSAMGKALTYALNQQKYLENYLKDGRSEIDNNSAERSIKSFVMGRKNFLFCDTVKGAKASAAIFSLIETAKENGLSVEKYLIYLLEKMPGLDLKETPELLEDLLPWAALPEICYTKK